MGTSNVEAGFRFGVPTFGTVAHSFVMAFEREQDAFQQMQRIFPQHSVLLVDTYDSLAAVDLIVREGLRPRGVRLDSGNLAELSKEVRRRLDAAGLKDTMIFASGDLNEYAIAALLAQGAPVDMFGVGTELATSKDAPTLSSVYKLVETVRDSEPEYRLKLSNGKSSRPGTKQVFRFSRDGHFERDLIACAGEEYPEAEPLLTCVMRNGRRIAPPPAVRDIQQYAREQLTRLPEECRRLREAVSFPIGISEELRRLEETERRKLGVG